MKVFIPSLLVCVLLASCHKDPVAPTPPVTPTNPTTPTTPTTPAADSTISIRLVNSQTAAASAIGTDFELIISQTDGVLLLDTVAPYNTTINATVKTNQKLVNVTMVTYSPSSDRYNVNMCTAIDPRGWNQLGNITQPAPATAVPARLVLINLPKDPLSVNLALQGSFFGGVGTNTTSYDETVPGKIIVGYGMVPNDYYYALLQDLGTYAFHAIKSTNDTIDLSHLDTAVRINFKPPAGYTLYPPILSGIMDSTDPNKTLLLSGSSGTGPLADLLFPKIPVQKYKFAMTGSTANNEFAAYATWLDTIPTTFPFPNSTNYTLNSTQNDNFSVSFHGFRPTEYNTLWTVGKITLYIASSPDSTTQHPLSLLTALKSRKLQGQSLTGLKETDFDMFQTPSLDYNTYIAMSYDSTRATRTFHLPSSISYYYSIN